MTRRNAEKTPKEIAVLALAVEWCYARRHACAEAMKGIAADPDCWRSLAETEIALSRAVDVYNKGELP